MEEHKLSQRLFAEINRQLEANDQIMHVSNIVDATIIASPTSTKIQEKRRDPEMHQTKNGNEWHFGMKFHVGVDAGLGHSTTLVDRPANKHDVSRAAALIRQDDGVFYGDDGYMGLEKRPEIHGDDHKQTIDYRISRCPRQVYRQAENNGQYWERVIERQSLPFRARLNLYSASLKSNAVTRRPFTMASLRTWIVFILWRPVQACMWVHALVEVWYQYRDRSVLLLGNHPIGVAKTINDEQ